MRRRSARTGAGRGSAPRTACSDRPSARPCAIAPSAEASVEFTSGQNVAFASSSAGSSSGPVVRHAPLLKKISGGCRRRSPCLRSGRGWPGRTARRSALKPESSGARAICADLRGAVDGLADRERVDDALLGVVEAVGPRRIDELAEHARHVTRARRDRCWSPSLVIAIACGLPPVLIERTTSQRRQADDRHFADRVSWRRTHTCRSA